MILAFLAIYKYNDADLNFLASYRSNRQQVVDCGEGSSKPSIIKSGVPLGSIFGTTFFFNINNDLPLLLDYCYIDLFTDGATNHINGKPNAELERKLQHDGNISKPSKKAKLKADVL